MLKNNLQQQFEQGNVALFDFEQAYATKHDFLPANVTARTVDVSVLERCNKETEELIATESAAFLQTSLDFFRKNEAEFLYVEAPMFSIVRIDSLAIEFDDMFKTYTALFGLKLQKKYEQAMRAHLDTIIPKRYSLSFDSADGLWEVNTYLTPEDGKETLAQTIQNIYQFIFELIEAVEEA